MRYGETCTASVGSMTLAMKAQSALSRAAIRSDVVKLSAAHARRGCTYGLEFSALQLNNVRMILNEARIPVKNIDCGEL